MLLLLSSTLPIQATVAAGSAVGSAVGEAVDDSASWAKEKRQSVIRHNIIKIIIITIISICYHHHNH